MSCSHCNSTGSLRKQMDGCLDCPHCDTASKRSALEGWAKAHGIKCDSVELYLIYRHGVIDARAGSRK